jgi:P27 family predicted phage terminase small subunit
LRQSYASQWKAEEGIRPNGTVVKSSKGQPMLDCFIQVANIAWQQWTHILTEFGMSPSSRSRVTIAKAPDREDEFEKFLQRGGLK